MQIVIGAVVFAVGCFFGAVMICSGQALEKKSKH